jgi:formate-dependent nitrite reductase membrane component NrfD
VQAVIFWLVGIAFFAAQAATLGYLLRTRRSTAGSASACRRVEIVWTLVPAAVIAALVLMTSGLTRPAWTQVRPGFATLRGEPGAGLRVLIAGPVAGAEAR